MSFTLCGLGTALPPDGFNQAEAIQVARATADPVIRDASWLPAVYKHSGVAMRYQALGRGLIDDLCGDTRESGSEFLPAEGMSRGPTTATRMRLWAQEALPLAAKAAATALAASGFEPESITHLVTVTCTGFVSPGIDFAVIEALGLRSSVERTLVGFMGCHGAINGLRVANSFARSEPGARVLMAAVELSSMHYYYGPESDKAVANALFSDGAAAVVGESRPDSADGWHVAATGSCIIPNSTQSMGWLIRDHGFEMILAREIPDLIAANLKPWLATWLAEHGLTISDVPSWAVHPGGPRILSAVQESVGLTAEQMAPSRAVLSQFGNMSSPTVLFIAEELRRRGAALPCVMIGFGPGLVAEAVLWR